MATMQKAEFISDVDQYMKGKTVEDQIMQLNEQLRAYKLREQQLQIRKARLLQRLPELKSALEAVTGLLAKKDSDEPLVLDFELTDSIYAKASVQQADSVNLWLGANVMVEFPLEEAQQLLQSNLEACTANLAGLETDLFSVKDSITITEVSVARVFNWDVEQRRKLKAAGGGSK